MTIECPFQPSHIDHIVLRSGDVPRLLGFYCDLLGCHVDRTEEKIGLFQLRAGTSLIDIVDVNGVLGREGGAAPGRAGRNLDHFCLRVEPFDADVIHRFLRANGVETGETKIRYGAEGEGQSIYIEDPDGNVVELKGPPGPA